MGFLIGKRKKSEKEPTQEQEKQTLSDVIRGMQYCVNTAAEITEEHYLSQLSKYFDEDGKPVMFTYQNSRGEIVQIPVFTLMNHAELLMEEINIKMSVPVRYSGLKKSEINDKAIDDFFVSRSTFYLDSLSTAPSTNGRDLEIEMKFKAGERPEAVSRIVDELMNTGVVHTTKEPGKQEV